jgi:hypothetical protein
MVSFIGGGNQRTSFKARLQLETEILLPKNNIVGDNSDRQYFSILSIVQYFYWNAL